LPNRAFGTLHDPLPRAVIGAATPHGLLRAKDQAPAPQQNGQLFDHLVGALLECRYLNLIKSVRLNVEALGFKGSFLAFALF
jgi:hypothetical protein